MNLYEEPDYTHELIEFLTDYEIRYASADHQADQTRCPVSS